LDNEATGRKEERERRFVSEFVGMQMQKMNKRRRDGWFAGRRAIRV
jgi:hypothetical protein